MRTSIECLPCMMRQGLRVLHLALPLSGDATRDSATLRQREGIMQRFVERLGQTGFHESPPGVLRHLYGIVRETTPCLDPYAEEKAEANARALELLPGLRERIASAADPLRTALNIAVIGNYLDAGTGITFDWEGALQQERSSALAQNGAFAAFAERIKPGATVLIVGDNCGEIALDTLMVEELLRRGCHVTYAVRHVPVLNDATLADAQAVGMTGLCRVISSGCDAPGTVKALCSDDFLAQMEEAHVVLAKGQGNFEGMAEDYPDVFYAFKAKCPVIARELDVAQGTTMFRRGQA